MTIGTAGMRRSGLECLSYLQNKQYPMSTTMFNPLRIPPWTLAVASVLLLGTLDLAAVLSAGLERLELHNPLGLAALAVVSETMGAPVDRGHPGRVLAAFQVFVALKVAVIVLLAILAAAACRARHPRRRLLLLAAQVACAVALDSVVFNVVATVQIAMLLPLRVGVYAVGGQYLLGAGADLLLVLDAVQRYGKPPMWTLLAYLVAERGILFAAFLFGRLVARERRARGELAAAHAQVLATQALLGDTVRGAERMRIARDLHDALGHHLTALNLHLDLARRQVGGQAPSALATAQEASRALLAQVRGVVSQERHDHDVDLGRALRTLCLGLPMSGIDLRIDEAAARHPAPVAHALFRCIQEAVTNAMRHAGATRLAIEVRARGGATFVRVADDGCGKAGAAEGSGLRGMRERVADLGGELRFARGIDGGFAVEVTLPVTELTA